MKVRQLLAAVFCMLLPFFVYGQTDRNDPEYRKFYLSVNAGWDFALGSSSTALTENLTLPATKRGFSPGFDGAWFFSKNYGVGIKYGFYTSGYRKRTSLEYRGHTPDSYVYELRSLSFKEKTHIFGPAIYARWPLGDSKWMILANAGVVALHNDLSEIRREIIKAEIHTINSPDSNPSNPSILEELREGASDHKGISAGFTLSAAIRYHLTPFAGISIQTSGLYASLSRMRYYNFMNERYETGDFSRKIGRVGLSAAIDFCF
ncbi:hypothetical protein [uncultured Proteiniphilum sp.]|uniref:hypothetical protein n=1 Tax=uncultured Proteiniphilum sp. TaxID=497637 RepID=UPI00261EED7F|nr:hypothetical protein [uncultured Proteiniphilum sp.]